jgi:hypothetical protein
MSRFISRNLKRITSDGRKVRDVSDGRVPGLTLVVQKSGVQSWSLRYRFGEHQRRYTIGRTTEVSAVQARKIAQSMLSKVAEGIDPQAEKASARTAEQTGRLAGGFVDQAKRFVETYARGKNKTWLDQGRHLGLALANSAARKDPTVDCEWAIIPGSPCDEWRKRAVKSITKPEIAEAVDAVTQERPCCCKPYARNAEQVLWLGFREGARRQVASRRHEEAQSRNIARPCADH